MLKEKYSSCRYTKQFRDFNYSLNKYIQFVQEFEVICQISIGSKSPSTHAWSMSYLINTLEPTRGEERCAKNKSEVVILFTTGEKRDMLYSTTMSISTDAYS